MSIRKKPTDEDPVAILERLLTQESGPQNAEHIKASRDFADADWAYQEMQAIEAEFARAFHKEVPILLTLAVLTLEDLTS